MRPELNETLVREAALIAGVCARPVISRVTDIESGEVRVVPISCGSTREDRCPPCADRAKRLRIQQCREGWHLDTEPEHHQPDDDDSEGDGDEDGDRRVRSTRRRQDAPDLPRLPMEDRTVGRVFTAPDGRTYRPSMFITLTLGSYGQVTSEGVPVDPERDDYRRAALDALHFPKLVDRFWQNLRRCAGYQVQYFASIEAQRRLAPTYTRRSGAPSPARSRGRSGPPPTTRLLPVALCAHGPAGLRAQRAAGLDKHGSLISVPGEFGDGLLGAGVVDELLVVGGRRWQHRLGPPPATATN